MGLYKAKANPAARQHWGSSMKVRGRHSDLSLMAELRLPPRQDYGTSPEAQLS